MIQEPAFAPAHLLADAIRARKISATEVLEHHLARIARYNPQLNAIVTLDEESARERAHAADAKLASGAEVGPLHGVPMTLKDGHATAGMRTTIGIQAFANHVPSEDSTVAARLKRAGAIIIGKTNVPPRLRDIQTFNPIFGRTNNPWNMERTPCGSSGGAAAALAAGLVPLEIGSDAGGSIRGPAHCCGVFGFKPTERTVPVTGSYADPPTMQRNFRILLSIGPLARTVDDLILAHRVIAGADGRDTEVPPLLPQAVRVPSLGKLRIAWAPTFPDVPAAAEIQLAIEGFASELSHAGAHVEERLPAVDFAMERQLFSDLMTWISRAFQRAADQPPLSVGAYLDGLNRRDEFWLWASEAEIAPVLSRRHV